MATDPGPQGRNEVRALLERHGRRPNKALGQHFLADPNLVERIVRLADVGPGDLVVEVGAGTGTLTAALAATGASVVAYEVDAGLEPVLTEVVGQLDNVEVRIADATAVDMAAELDRGEWTMVANLPYQAATPLLLDSLRDVPQLRRYVVMIQREVAERLVASPGTKAYGIPTVSVALRAETRFGFAVPPQVFVPAPAVDSAVISLDRIEPAPAADRAEEIAAAAFGQRRKMIRRSLRTLFDDPIAVISAAELDPTTRAEDLAPADYLRLAEVSA